MDNQIREIDIREDHANHLAGTVAATSESEKLALAGISPGVRVLNYPVLKWARTPDLQERFAEHLPRFRAGDPTVVLCSTAFSSDEQTFANKEEVKGHTIGEAIWRSSPLWVTAAGHSETSPGGYEVTIHSKLPMAMGRFPNVLSVTACARCTDRNFSLMEFANHGKDFVHVVAPGTVLSHSGANGYVRGAGTSQAAALIAGVALEMLRRYPGCYKDPYYLKERIQVTSMPVGDASGEIAAGFIELPVSLLDPRKTWGLPLGGDRLAGTGPDGYVPVDDLRGEKLVLVDSYKDVTEAKGILRIVRNSRGKYFVYKKTSKIGKIAKLGPFSFRGIQEGPQKTKLKNVAYEDLIFQSCFESGP